MCAIAGIIGIPAEEFVCRRLLKTMERRGPDGQGSYQNELCTLLHTRLAIIDPEGGQQPMVCTWNGCKYVIVYNGELYNTQEVRSMLQQAGHCFASRSDTEVVLRAFIHWGQESLQLLNGIFAFAVWIESEKKVFIARDRMGVKPCFYKQHRGGLIFASEIKTILAYPSVRAQLDAVGAAQVLLLGPGRMPGSGVFKDIYELEPGCCAWYSDGKLAVERYWQLSDREHTETFEETAEHVRYLVTDAICRQMVSDVPIGCFLSGGLDSSLISAVCAAAAQEVGEPFRAFSLDYRNNEKYFTPGKFQPAADTGYIGIMQDWLHTDSRWTVLEPDRLLDYLEDATIARDLPGMADVDFSLLAFCADIRKGVKVALSGECADEIFGGYPWYRDPEVREHDGFPWAQNTRQRAAFLGGWISDRVDAEEFVYSAYRDTIDRAHILPENDPLERRMKQMVNLNYRWFMQTLLDRKDRMSMYNGLEVRVPFCDYRIAEYLYSVPWHYKDHDGYEKGLLRYAMRQWLPEEVLWRKKSPYPKTHDPVYGQCVAARLRKILKNKHSPLLQLASRKALEELLDSTEAKPWYGQLMQVPQTMAYMAQVDFWMRSYDVQLV